MKPSHRYLGMPLYLADDVKKIESSATQIGGYELYQLMLRAGQAAWQALLNKWPNCKNIVVIAGSGNNAGDGFVLAQLAHQQGFNVVVLTVSKNPQYKGDAATAFENLQQTEVSILHYHKQLLSGSDVIVDAILGTGLTGPLRSQFLEVIESLNDFVATEGVKASVYSLDISSGLNADTGCVDPCAVRADHCISFINYKPGMYTAKAREYCRSFELADLAIDARSRDDVPIHAYCDDSQELIHSLPKRSRTSHKGDHGHLLLIGGDYGFGGAILMSGLAAARTGVGKLTILTRDSHVAPILTQFPEAMICSIEDSSDPLLEELIANADAIVIGPGLGQQEWGKVLLERVLKTDKPILVDADGLNILAQNPIHKDNWVLTPHPGEASRLLDTNTQEAESDRYQTISQLQKKYQGIVVLKGAGTLIADEDLTTVCTKGNPGMATGGMGDILSGIIGSLLAQGLAPFHAARAGVALHAVAGDMAAKAGEKGLLATDLIDPIRQLVNE